MLYGRRPAWAQSTNFRPQYDDANQIIIRLDSKDMAIYESLTQWLVRNVNSDAAEILSIEKADEILTEVSK